MKKKYFERNNLTQQVNIYAIFSKKYCINSE